MSLVFEPEDGLMEISRRLEEGLRRKEERALRWLRVLECALDAEAALLGSGGALAGLLCLCLGELRIKKSLIYSIYSR